MRDISRKNSQEGNSQALEKLWEERLGVKIKRLNGKLIFEWKNMKHVHMFYYDRSAFPNNFYLRIYRGIVCHSSSANLVNPGIYWTADIKYTSQFIFTTKATIILTALVDSSRFDVYRHILDLNNALDGTFEEKGGYVDSNNPLPFGTLCLTPQLRLEKNEISDMEIFQSRNDPFLTIELLEKYDNNLIKNKY